MQLFFCFFVFFLQGCPITTEKTYSYDYYFLSFWDEHILRFCNKGTHYVLDYININYTFPKDSSCALPKLWFFSLHLFMFCWICSMKSHVVLATSSCCLYWNYGCTYNNQQDCFLCQTGKLAKFNTCGTTQQVLNKILLTNPADIFIIGTYYMLYFCQPDEFKELVLWTFWLIYIEFI